MTYSWSAVQTDGEAVCATVAAPRFRRGCPLRASGRLKPLRTEASPRRHLGIDLSTQGDHHVSHTLAAVCTPAEEARTSWLARLRVLCSRRSTALTGAGRV